LGRGQVYAGRDDRGVFLYAFDLIELDGDDLRREPIERRKVLLMRLLAKATAGPSSRHQSVVTKSPGPTPRSRRLRRGLSTHQIEIGRRWSLTRPRIFPRAASMT